MITEILPYAALILIAIVTARMWSTEVKNFKRLTEQNDEILKEVRSLKHVVRNKLSSTQAQISRIKSIKMMGRK